MLLFIFDIVYTLFKVKQSNCVCVLLFYSSDSVCNHGDDHLRGWSCKPQERGSSQWTAGVDPSTCKQASANQREEEQWVTAHIEILWIKMKFR